MKHQYFADITDYKKYSILRFLSQDGKNSILVNWMLTQNDLSNDGKHIKYLEEPEIWRVYEPDIFDSFTKNISRNKRNLKIAEEERYLQNTDYFSCNMSDTEKERNSLFTYFISRVKHKLVFLDPDNGAEVDSVKYGRKNSSKYVYWQEVEAIYNTGSSLLIYQHFARVRRKPYIKKQVDIIKKLTGCEKVIAFQTSWTVFFLILQDNHFDIVESIEKFQKKWGKGIVIHAL